MGAIKRIFSSRLSLLGVLMFVVGGVAGLSLIIVDMQSPFQNPYAGIFTYMVVPVFLVLGLILVFAGIWRSYRRRRRGEVERTRLLVLDLNRDTHFWAVVLVMGLLTAFILLSALGSYKAYQFTESTTFCGLTCHTVMKPEHTAYQNSPHANVSCAECHIGPGADWFVKSKLSGLRQVIAVMKGDFSRPIPTPVQNLRPAKETCYHCHWPAKFHGGVTHMRTYFAADETNTPWSISLLVKVGGGDEQHGPVEGIHWHMALENKVEYIAADERRQEIPWVRITRPDGTTSTYQMEGEELDAEALAEAEVRQMDCIDCHNRPSHKFYTPNQSVDNALKAGRIDRSIPWIKRHAVDSLAAEYETEPEALAAIEAYLRDKYPEGGEAIEQAITEVLNIYRSSFFPEMKVRWDQYPDNIGHLVSPGCFRCHDGLHADESGEVLSMDCNVCHIILGQGPGDKVTSMAPAGMEFKHPEDIDEMWKETRCDECHTGVPD